MDIVRSVRIKVTPKQYILLKGDGEKVKVVQECLGLFGLSPVDEGRVEIDDNTVLVENKTQVKNGNLELTSRIVFLCDEQLQRLEEVSSCKLEWEECSILEKRLIKKNLHVLMNQVMEKKPSPWGVLRGVRPTKIVHKLLDKGFIKQDIIRKLQDEYAVNFSKAELLVNIAEYQRPFLNSSPKSISIYIGIPYCPSKCLYCSFPSYVLPASHEVDSFLHALGEEMLATKKLVDRFGLVVENVYIGGGTPTSLDSGHFEQLLSLVQNLFINKFTREYTVEAGRPDSITDKKITLLKEFGVTRVSVNPQSMQKKTLNYIGRMHTVQAIIDVFQKMRQVYIPVINMDLIAGLPGETEADMKNTMEQIIALNPDNLTVHTLALKKGAELKYNRTAKISLPSEEVTERMLNISREYLAELGLNPYYLYRQKYMTGNFENIGYARKGTECLYNIQIMEERQTIIGHGPGASTKVVNPFSWHLDSCYNPKDVQTYIKYNFKYRQQKIDLLTSFFEGEYEC